MKKYIYIAVLLLAYSCNTSINNQLGHSLDTSVKQNPEDSLDSVRKKMLENALPVFGYRFVISGDFDGDGKTEKLTEHYFSKLWGKETEKFYSNTEDMGQDIDLAIYKRPYSFVYPDNENMDTLRISDRSQLFGLSYLKNEGDLNGDGTDEISYVVDWADWSNLNTWHIVTYKDKKWQELYAFPIWDWQLPELPGATNQYGLFGTEAKFVIPSDSINQALEQDLKSFPGLVKKVGKKKIQVIYRSEEADERTKIVKLK